MAAIAIVLSSGSAYALADDPALTDPVGDLDGGAGKGVSGANTRTAQRALWKATIPREPKVWTGM